MEKNWVLIYSASKLYQAELLKEILNENDIICDIINKKDSAFLLGDIEVYVQKQNEEKALAFVKEFKA
ncbi:MAG: DUF2007 domain-containing protein [Bacteroidales bacterium]|nr:DUF2007 domain-containing protein [Bacteroidales bacterium]MCF8458511.1 DUF2007 domain-containing protein [Bacteroidales bacterium]